MTNTATPVSIAIGIGTCEKCHREGRPLKRLATPISWGGRDITDICIEYPSCHRIAWTISPEAEESKRWVNEARRIEQDRISRESAGRNPLTGRKQQVAKEPTPCECGCKAKTKGRFAPGHDARLKSCLYAVIRGEAPKHKTVADGMTPAQAKKFLEKNGWPQPAERKPKATKKPAKKATKSTKKAASKGKARAKSAPKAPVEIPEDADLDDANFADVGNGADPSEYGADNGDDENDLEF